MYVEKHKFGKLETIPEFFVSIFCLIITLLTNFVQKVILHSVEQMHSNYAEPNRSKHVSI